MRRASDWANEHGAALISAMLIVSIMAVVSMTLMETVRYATRLSLNLEAREQAQLYAIGAEELAAGTVSRNWIAGAEQQPAMEVWVGQPFFFPIQDGSIQGSAADHSNCFNLNSLVTTGDGVDTVSNPLAIEMFARLLGLLDVVDGEASSIATATADWIDSDRIAGFGGAEDDFYGALETPYRTAGNAMVDPSELRRIRGINDEIYERIRPFICTLPETELNILNLNTMQPWQSPLLAVYLAPETSATDALRVLEERPVGGFRERAEIPEFSAIAAFNLEPAQLQYFDVRSRFVQLNVQVSYKAVFVEMLSSLQISDTGDITTVSRRFGSDG